MLTEEKKIDKIEIVNNCIQVRERTDIKKDGVVIASSYHRVAYSEQDDLTGVDSTVLEIAKIIWPNKFADT